MVCVGAVILRLCCCFSEATANVGADTDVSVDLIATNTTADG